MTPKPMGPTFNRLLEALPPNHKSRLLSQCDHVELDTSQVLYEPGDPLRHIHFPTSAFVSLSLTVDGHEGLQGGMIGNEGALGYELALHVDKAPLHAQVQGAGMAWRLPAGLLHEELQCSAALRGLLNRYVCVLLAQSVRSGACYHFHLIEERLARWLLTAQDCAHSPRLKLTHDFLARTLGVRRVGITNAATSLHQRQLIDYRRGIVTIIDRGGLEAAACGCYHANLLSYASLLT